ncbi:hypothetical protein [Paenibacillus chitinolyticus]|uniref:Uncharacterized protein n=1 Tax=Paenibacillus chitinolyticus TaxID=79263 RepID=A0ABT4FM93_9BACL|nr:hypothetical protein [Paenibacillus chitinolyticus]MCY9593990.1 hypothetical protein [Paenibacillus chitinolyticus]MCY9599645.1 hypothetical protein [Paenibacillus chitinolyticus]
MQDIRDFLAKRITYAKRRAFTYKNEHGENPEQTHNYFGGYSLGYWEGKVAAYQYILDELEGVGDVENKRT